MNALLPFNNQRAPVYARDGMACSSTPLAAVVGRDILKAGGNAVDAALAMAAVVNVTEPMMSGLGGDMFAMVWKDGKVHGLNASGRSGSLMTLERVRAEHGDTMPHAGAATVNVPGALDGYLALHSKFGTMELADLFEPAAALVDGGFPVGQKIAQVWAAGSALLRKFSPGSTDYLPGGNVPAPGALFRQPDLARLWRRIGREGRAAFYGGETRDRIVETVAKNGGYLEAGDFDTIQAEWVEPIRGSYRGHTVLEMPPNGQGIVALEALAILEGYDMATIFATNEVQASHLILEAIKLAYADAAATVADPRFLKAPIENLLDPAFIAARRASIDPDHALENPPAGRVFGDTTYLTVVDRNRMAVSLITSISGPFGSGLVVPGLGVVLNNRLADFVLVPGHPNAAGPGKRVRHTILPSMVLGPDGQLKMSFGCMGGNMQPQGQVQILLNLIDRGMNLQQALDAPRLRVLDGKRVSIEPHPLPDLGKRLAAMGHVVVWDGSTPASPGDVGESFEGSAQAILLGAESLCGASDPRLDGIACPL
jgi:gamma-glutamyltranspeptidase / glutathione hydrolase